ncbi:hypothetical protein NNJEOMEG_02398 [Fundidesulfovibrio magnetotacticus]|uniref:ADP-heptose:LPS heptosyltransferase n=1 Tax=Fundidesulfovibrio magnetotacticus TaxID=2730080 RepID=A0A6V8LPS2_9BACT|nr:glycosyltransferase family 9 protein [Fundidesulfovibrio magnetotacticus]GFK94552.1 hypothetical protein NNJEOMEG_02398 [Fundidesulfovibrio magnetotacticus]
MNTLVVNLTRFGDLLQTQPVVCGLAARGERVGLVCLENFVQATALLSDLSHASGIPGARFLADLDRSWPHALAGCLDYADKVRREFAPDRVINLTPSLPARLLARALSGGAVQGFGLDDFGFGAYSTPWAAFLEATSRHRGSSPFNLVDLFRKAAHLDDDRPSFRLKDPEPAALEALRALLAELGAPPGASPVGLQLGASAAMRQWPVESFASLARHLLDRHGLFPVLLGSGGEQALAEAFAASGVPHASLVGRTGLAELAAAVRLMRLVVSNDTGTMHLAAGLGVPVLAVFLATAQPWDTGPYLPGACCVEPDMECHPCPFGHQCPIGWACREKVRPEVLAACVDGWMERGVWPELPGRGVRLWESVVQPDGFMGLRSLSGHGSGERAVWIGVQRLAWRRFLDGLPPAFEGHEADALTEEFRAGLRTTLEQASALLELLAQQARVLLAAPRPALRAKFMTTWQRLHALFSADQRLCALAHLWLHLSQDEGQDIARFAAFADSVSQLVRALRDLLASRP